MIPAPREQFETVWHGGAWREVPAPVAPPPASRPFLEFGDAEAERLARRRAEKAAYERARRAAHRKRRQAERRAARVQAEAEKSAHLWRLLATPHTVAALDDKLRAAGHASKRNSVATRLSKAVYHGVVEAVIVGHRGRAGVYRRSPAFAQSATFPPVCNRRPPSRKER